MSFEKKAIREIRKRFSNVVYHQWLTYHADGKKGLAEPEGWIEFENEVLLFECKLTGNLYGQKQMEGLYKPLLEHLLGKPVRCLLICRGVTPETPLPFIDGPEAFLVSDLDFATWHLLV